MLILMNLCFRIRVEGKKSVYRVTWFNEHPQSLHRLFKGIASSGKVLLAFCVCALAIVLSYRIYLSWALFTRTIRPFDFNPSAHPVWFMIRGVPYDLVLILSCVILIGFFIWTFNHLSQGYLWRFLSILGYGILHLLIFCLLILHGAHVRLLFEAQTGITFFIIQEFFLNVPWQELIKFIDWKDGLFGLVPLGLFWGVLWLPSHLRVFVLKSSIGIIVPLSLFSLIGVRIQHAPLPSEVRLNPVLFFLADLREQVGSSPSCEGEYGQILQEEKVSLQPGGKEFQSPINPLKFLPPPQDTPWNIVLFIMESVGNRYIFDTSQGHGMPMPFLHGLAKESWYFKKHYTSSNISTKAVFSLLSGLYDFFHQETFGSRPDASVPSLHTYLPKGYEAFFVTPAPIQWYFPVAFVKNNELKEMHHFENLPLKVRMEKNSFGRYIGRDEVETIHFFNQRIRKAKEPFLGIYISFAAHLPYFDYGPDYRIIEPADRMIHRYFNNLYLLDHMLNRVYENLREMGLLKRTILVIVGDHGQAFGQHHPDNYMHHRYSYDENLETPAIIYQPTLFKPRTVEVPTSHVDLLPTLLDALRIPYVSQYLDGESLFHHRLRRKYVFIYGYEGTISSVDQHLIKVQYSLKKKRCWAFDLKVDPDERNPLECSSYESQLDDLLKFVRFHDVHLVAYNEMMKEKRLPPMESKAKTENRE